MRSTAATTWEGCFLRCLSARQHGDHCQEKGTGLTCRRSNILGMASITTNPRGCEHAYEANGKWPAPHRQVLKTALSDHLVNCQKINNPPNCPPTFELIVRNFQRDAFSKLLIFMVRPDRFELPTFWFVARRSIQLSYGRFLGNVTLPL